MTQRKNVVLNWTATSLRLYFGISNLSVVFWAYYAWINIDIVIKLYSDICKYVRIITNFIFFYNIPNSENLFPTVYVYHRKTIYVYVYSNYLKQILPLIIIYCMW